MLIKPEWSNCILYLYMYFSDEEKDTPIGAMSTAEPPSMRCNTPCACELRLPAGLSAPYQLTFRGENRLVNFSTSDSACTLGHEIPANTSWQDRTNQDVVKVLLSTYMAPPVIVITLVTNLLICIVLTRKH
uniref:G_PROTEIN_RECEP_F1_2 domain-containing protein n=1 Tax=Macrostomum lignano TaxID=282301 RepID=A0A1I8FE23_9PLAT